MIQFFINNIELVLPTTFSATTIDENVLITRDGEYTLDNEVSLLEPANAKAFNHMYRLNKSTVDKTGDCTMIVNSRVKIGKFIVISNTDISVSWQFVAGNSEVTYVSNETEKIWKLDFGTESEITYARALSSITNPIWTNNFVCVPIKFSNCIANNYLVEEINLNNGSPIIGVENIVMQPYLLYYINKLPELLGFTMSVNVLNTDSRAQKEFISNRVQSLNYSDALPDLTISEFISAIEYSFNVVFNFKTENKTLEIINTKTFIANKKTVQLNNIVGSYIRKVSTEVYRFDVNKLTYDLESGGVTAYQSLSDEIMEHSTIVEHVNVTYLKNSLVESDKNKFKIHTTTNNNRQYVFSDAPVMSIYRRIVPDTTGFIVHINKFRSYIGQDYNEDEKELTMGITPLPYVCAYKEFVFSEGQGGDWTYNASYQLPIINSELYTYENQSIIEAIESSINTIPRGSSIQVGLYNGLMKLPIIDANSNEDISCIYPISFIDKLPEFWLNPQEIASQNIALSAARFDLWVQNVYSLVAIETLKLIDDDGIYNTYFVDNYKFDTNFKYYFNIIDNPDLISENIFEFENNKYMPILFSREKSDNNNIVESVFYRMK